MKLLSTFAVALLAPGLLSAQTTPTYGQVVGPSCTVSGTPDCRGSVVGWSYGQDATGTPGNTREWWADRQDGGFAEVTKTRGQVGYGGYGHGSLELRATGVDDRPGSNEWAFWYQFAGGASYEFSRAAKFGTLGSLSKLSFDWFRNGDANGVTDWDKTETSADWAYKTPVLRLRLLENAGTANEFESELVWEGWYNQSQVGAAGTPVDQWVTTANMQTGSFWYARPPSAGGSASVTSGDDCTLVQQSAWQGAIASYNIEAMISDNCLAADTWITGVAVGIGSRWPHRYSAFVDNVYMGFDDDNGYRTAVNTNFDFIPVPEPSSVALVGVGAAALAIVSRRRRRQ